MQTSGVVHWHGAYSYVSPTPLVLLTPHQDDPSKYPFTSVYQLYIALFSIVWDCHHHPWGTTHFIKTQAGQHLFNLRHFLLHSRPYQSGQCKQIHPLVHVLHHPNPFLQDLERWSPIALVAPAQLRLSHRQPLRLWDWHLQTLRSAGKAKRDCWTAGNANEKVLVYITHKRIYLSMCLYICIEVLYFNRNHSIWVCIVFASICCQ